jgi:hypothetical protein
MHNANAAIAAKENAMKWFLMNAAALILGLAVTGAAVADKGKNSGSSSHYSHHEVKGSYHEYHEYKAPYREYKGPYYQGEHNRFWSSRSWSESYGCYLHWCPRERCYFYWCEPFGCYYPTDYCPTGRYDY